MRRIKLPTKSMSFWVAIILSLAAGASVLFALYTLYMPTKVLVPKNDIKAGAVIGQADIGQITISKRDKHANALTEPRLVIGKYAKEQLYAKEPILAPKLINDPQNSLGDGNVLRPDETYFTFKPGDARWPRGIKTGDYVSVMGVPKVGNPVIIGAKIKVVNVSGDKVSAGQIDQLKSVVTNSDNSITLQLRWKQLGSLFAGRNISDELWILPEHPEKETGGTIYDQGDIARIRSEAANYQTSTGKANSKAQKLIP